MQLHEPSESDPDREDGSTPNAQCFSSFDEPSDDKESVVNTTSDPPTRSRQFPSDYSDAESQSDSEADLDSDECDLEDANDEYLDNDDPIIGHSLCLP